MLSVALLSVVSAGALVAWHAEDDVRRRSGLHAEQGRLLALWLEIANRATMRVVKLDEDAGLDEDRYRTRLRTDPGGWTEAPASLPGAPPGLRVPAGLTLGIMPDVSCGSDPDCVPMAWAVLAVPEEARSDARLGALDAGLVDVAVGGLAVSSMQRHAAAIGAARGTAIEAGALFVTADLALPHDEDALYRRQQPGRPWANRMEAGLDMHAHSVVEAYLVEGLEGQTRTPGPGVTDPDPGDALKFGSVAVSNDPSVCAADADGDGVPDREAGECEATVLGDGEGVDLESDRAEVAELVGVADLRVVRRDPTDPESGRLNAGSGAVTGRLAGEDVVADGRVDAGSLTATVAADAALLIVGGSLTGVGTFTAGARFYGGQWQAGGLAVSGGLDVGTLNMSGGGGVGGSSWSFGSVTTGSCNGCIPEDEDEDEDGTPPD